MTADSPIIENSDEDKIDGLRSANKTHEERKEQNIRVVNKTKKAHELEQAFKEFAGHKMLVTIQGPPDPDSIACAMAHKFIGQNFGVDVQIIYFDTISHPENRAPGKSVGS